MFRSIIFSAKVFMLVLFAIGGTAHGEYNPIFVFPEEDAQFSGFQGEPESFTPDSVIYTLENYRTNTENVSITSEEDWVTINPGTVAVAGSGGTSDVAVTLNENVGGLTPGLHEAIISFESNYPTRTRVIQVYVMVRLCDALDVDCDLWEFETGGDAEWYGQTVVTYDGVDAAQSGAIGNNQETWMETVVHTPGDIRFWWKVSSEEGFAPLEFYVNGVLIDSISGDVDWHEVTVTLDADDPDYLDTGAFVLRWSYVKDRAYPVGADCGWVDQLSFAPADYLMVNPSAPQVVEVCIDPENPLAGEPVVDYTVVNTDPSEPCVPENPPVITECADDPGPLALDENCEALMPDLTGDVVYTDECDDAEVTQEPVAGTPISEDTLVTITVADDAGSDTCQVLVTVEDDIPPVITLLGDDPQIIECGDAYVESGATAHDNCDGDLTDDIVIDASGVDTSIAGEYTLTYNVEDSAGNVADVARTVQVQNTSEPTITLLGVNPQNISLGDAYEELGAEAWDACDGDITDEIVIDASGVDTDTVGEYTVTYNVVDSEGNAADQVTRTVNVLDTEVPFVIDVMVETGWTVLVTFNKGMGTGVLEANNYTISGDGQGTLTDNPNLVELDAGNTYRLTWECPGIMLAEQDVTVTVDEQVEDADENTMADYRSGTHPAGAIAEIPVITLLGDDPLSIPLGEDYVEPGAEATDYCGENINEDIVIDASEVDTTTVGEYTVYYNVTDGAGNVAEQVTRVVEVIDAAGPSITDVTVETGWTVLVTFSKEMGAGVLDENNYTISGDGRGTLTGNPDSVVLHEDNTYRLTWNCPGIMLDGEDVTITVSELVEDADGNAMDEARSATDAGGAIAILPQVTFYTAGEGDAARLWEFETDAEGLVDGDSTSPVMFRHTADDGNPAGSVEFVGPAIQNVTETETGVGPAGVTWEDWGVPAGAIIHSVQITGWDRRMAVVDNQVASIDMVMRLVDETGESVHGATDLVSEALPTEAGGWTGGAAGAVVNVDAASQTSDAQVALELEYTIATGGGAPGNHNAIVRFDNIALTINYTKGDLIEGDTIVVEENQPFDWPVGKAEDACNDPLADAVITDDAGIDNEIGADAGTYEVVYSAVDVVGNVGDSTLIVEVGEAKSSNDLLAVTDPPEIVIETESEFLYASLLKSDKSDLSWSVTQEHDVDWLEISTMSGDLGPGAEETVSVTFTAAADALDPGVYEETLIFTNEASGYQLRRTIILRRSEEPPVLPDDPSPEDGETDVSPASVVLAWNTADPEGCLTRHTVNFGEDPEDWSDVYDTGAESILAMPLLDEDTTYYWQVIAENCCGITEGPVWEFSTGAVNALVHFISCGGGENYAETALHNLGYDVVSTDDPDVFEALLAAGYEREIVIVDVQGGGLAASTLGALEDHYDNAGGRIIFSHSGLEAYSEDGQPFLGCAGVDHVSSFTDARDVYVWQPEPMFTAPNALNPILLTTALCPEYGHTVRLRGEGSRALAGYTSAFEDEQAAIVVNKDFRIIVNAFRPQTFIGDQNNSGVDDMIELYENQIFIVAIYGGDETLAIELLGDDPAYHECADAYETSGVFARDFNGEITDIYYIPDDVEDVNTNVRGIYIDLRVLDPNVVGDYSVAYTATDGEGNSASRTREVNVVDEMAPLLSLLGDPVVSLECGYSYVSPGAWAWDACDGDLSTEIQIDTSALNIYETGAYDVYYSVTDAAGNTSAELVRTVNVVDTEAPIITLEGEDPQIIELGDEDGYVELGATASDACDGDLTDDIVIDASNVDAGAVGVYTVTYNVTDGAGNEADEIRRTVEVIDTTPPEIFLGTFEPDRFDEDGFLLQECSESFEEPEDFAVIDDHDGDLGDVQPDLEPGMFGIAAWAWALDENQEPVWLEEDTPDAYAYDVFTDILSDYLLLYIVADSHGNVYPELNENGIPLLLLDDDGNPDFLDVDGALKEEIDFARLVRVQDTTIPVVTELLGDGSDADAPLILECAAEYESPGAMAWDDCDGDISEHVEVDISALDLGNAGEYQVYYSATDSSGNTSDSVTRYVQVVDTSPPVITLIGDSEIVVECGDPYDEQGADAWDECDDDVSDEVVIGGDEVNVNRTGTYVITYNVSDEAGNPADEVIRIVRVVDTTPPEISLLGDDEVIVECGDLYEDAGATASDHCDGDLTEAIVTAGEVDVNTVGEYVITYDVADGAGHEAETVERVIRVEDTTPPVITLLGDAEITLDICASYDDAGAEAWDDCDGDLTAAIVVEGDDLDTTSPGEHTVTYNVSDNEGNAAEEVARTVNVVSVAPVIVLPAYYVPIDCADEFDDAFAAVVEAFDITAEHPCGEVTEDVRVQEIKVTYPRRGDEITYSVEKINSDIIEEGKIDDFDGEYTGTLEETITLFQRYFLFKPAVYEVTFIVQNTDAEAVTQIIRIDDECRGCLGCYSCDSCAQQRPLPKTFSDWKRIMGDWLLVGLSMLVLAGLSINKRKQ